MSSLHTGTEPDATDASKMVHHFQQPVPIASYLIAIVVGNLVCRHVSHHICFIVKQSISVSMQMDWQWLLEGCDCAL